MCLVLQMLWLSDGIDVCCLCCVVCAVLFAVCRWCYSLLLAVGKCRCVFVLVSLLVVCADVAPVVCCCCRWSFLGGV